MKENHEDQKRYMTEKLKMQKKYFSVMIDGENAYVWDGKPLQFETTNIFK